MHLYAGEEQGCKKEKGTIDDDAFEAQYSLQFYALVILELCALLFFVLQTKWGYSNKLLLLQ
jgi:hypothetical protein